MTFESYPSSLAGKNRNLWEQKAVEPHLLNPVLKQSESIYPWEWQYLCTDGKEIYLINVVAKIAEVLKGVFLFWLTDRSNIKLVNSVLLNGLSDIESQKYLTKTKTDEMISKIKDKPEHRIVLDYLNAKTPIERQEILYYHHKDNRNWVMNMGIWNGRADHFPCRHDLKYEYRKHFLEPLLAQKKHEYLCWSDEGLVLVGSFQAFVQWVKTWFGLSNLTDKVQINSIILKGLYEGEINGFLTYSDVVTIFKKMKDGKDRPVQLSKRVNTLVKKLSLKNDKTKISFEANFKGMQDVLTGYHVKNKRDLIPNVWIRVIFNICEYFYPGKLPQISAKDNCFGDTPLAMAKLAAKKKDQGQALHYFKIAQRINNTDPVFQNKLGAAFIDYTHNKYLSSSSYKEIFIGLAQTARANKNDVAAENYFEKALLSFKDDSELLYHLGELYISKQEYVKIEKCLPALIKNYETSNDHVKLENLGNAYCGLKNYSKAVECWKKSAEICEKVKSPDNTLKASRLWKQVGDEYLSGNAGYSRLWGYDYEQACDNYEKALNKGLFSNKKFYEELVDNYLIAAKLSQDPSKRYMALLNSGLVKEYVSSHDDNALERIAKKFDDLKLYQEAFEYRKKILIVYDTYGQGYDIPAANLWKKIGDDYFEGRLGYNYPMACESYEKALQKAPATQGAFENYLKALKQLDAKEIPNRFSSMIQVNDKRKKGNLCFQIAEAYFNSKIGVITSYLGIFNATDYETAFKYYELACESDESLRNTFQERFKKIGDEKNCVDSYEKAYRANPKEYGEHILFLLKLYLINQNLSKAIILYKEISIKWTSQFTLLELKPGEWHALGVALGNADRRKSNDEIVLDKQLTKVDSASALFCLKKANDALPITQHQNSYYGFILDIVTRMVEAKKSLSEIQNFVNILIVDLNKSSDVSLKKKINNMLKTVYQNEAELYLQKIAFDDSKEFMDSHTILEDRLTEIVDGLTRKDWLKNVLGMYSEAIKCTSEDATLYFDMGQVYWLLDDFRMMEHYCEEAHKLKPKNFFYMTSYCWALKMNDKVDEAGKFKYSLEQAPQGSFEAESDWRSECFIKDELKKHRINPHTFIIK